MEVTGRSLVTWLLQRTEGLAQALCTEAATHMCRRSPWTDDDAVRVATLQASLAAAAASWRAVSQARPDNVVGWSPEVIGQIRSRYEEELHVLLEECDQAIQAARWRQAQGPRVQVEEQEAEAEVSNPQAQVQEVEVSL